ncbi:L-serine ammonia-lyase, iron-sulfur-dependent, subunit alpha [uncultured Tyzzerella sp.]|uniref:L-serine ammonia-lyase, iron-sulfur-dependent, subunit alpha n=1 Tax=uncultured Tyzzerella sp. TaxID=2321398 RepID=UPI002942F312|nr:L-serine ammonia-lyase, iron-sulfur-dependent, subunit alpha [uncultured Tyzzerella sp.]
MNFNYAKELLDLCEKNNLPISEVMIRRELANTDTTREEIIQKMTKSLNIMKDAIKTPLETTVKTMGGLIGGEEKKLIDRLKEGKTLSGSLTTKALAYALGVLEVNTSMGIIVAAPTAGAAGVLPGLLLALKEEFNLSDECVLNGLFNASAIGYLLMRNASVAGAEAGCQAEVGSASAMAAAAAVEMMGGSPQQCMYAASTALQNLLGLVCDPVAGLVEVPCQARNGIGTTNALICAEMALAGISNIIPLDEMIECMYSVGKNMPSELRETALGGCAKTPTGCSKCYLVK